MGSGRQYDDVDAICPFFILSKPNSITCEGIKDKTSLTLSFRTDTGQSIPKDRKDYRTKFCDKNYKDCKIFKLLEEKYK